MVRSKPNILITGTPGVGKSTLCNEIINHCIMQYLDVNDIAKRANCFVGYDNKLESNIIDEDKLLDEMEAMMEEGGKLVEYHSNDLFPERWFDIVFVLCTDNTILYDRLKQRGYNDSKITNNVQCEIFQAVYEEAYEAYKPEIVHKLTSNTDHDVETNAKTIVSYIDTWLKNNNCNK